MTRAFGSALVAFCCLGACLAGCDAIDPLERPDLWRPDGVNEANIAAQLAAPGDLAFGRAATGGSDGQLAAAAVARLLADRVKRLPDTGLTDLQVQSSGAAPPSGGS